MSMDDVSVSASLPHLIHDLVRQLQTKREIKRLRPDAKYVSWNITHTPQNDIAISKAELVFRIVYKTKMQNYKRQKRFRRQL